MKKSISAFMALLTTGVTINATAVDIEELNKVPSISKKIEITKAYDLGDIYHVRGKLNNGQVHNVFITKDKKHIIFGDGFKLDDNEKLDISIDMKQYEKYEAFTYGNGDDEYYVFTDPECPFCVKFEKLMKKMGDKAKFHVFLYPLPMHKNADNMSMYVLSKPLKDRAKTLENIMINGSNEYKNIKSTKELQTKLSEQKKVAAELNINSTPTVLDKTGKTVSWPNLAKTYNIQLDLDSRAMDFLKKNNIAMKLDSKGSEDVYLFLDMEKDKKFIKSKHFEEIVKNYQVNIVFSASASTGKDGLTKSLLVLSEQNKTKAFYEVADKEMKADDRKKAAELLKDKTINQSLMGGIMFTEKAGVVKTPLMVDSNGKVLE